MQTVTLEEAKARLEELVGEAAKGEEVTITRDARPVARITAPPEPPAEEEVPNEDHAHLLGLWKGSIEFRPGWDEPEDFGPDYR